MLGSVTEQYGRSQTNPPSGWYPDPAGTGQERFWDGTQWTGQLRQAPVAAPPMAPQYPAGFQQPGYQPAVVYPAGPQWVPQPNYAHWGWRVLAYVIDAFLVNIVAQVIATPFLGDFVQALNQWERDLMAVARSGSTSLPPMFWEYPGITSGILVITLSIYLVHLVYTVAMLSTVGATLGKLAVGLRVVPVGELEAKKLPVGAAVIRSVGFVLCCLIPIFNLVNYLSPLWRAKRQAFHDSAAKTVVLKVR